MTREPVIRIESLNKRFGEIRAVKNLSFEVNRGDLFGFLGPNGAGKSVTLYILLGLVRPTSGALEIFGKSQKDMIHVRSRMGALIETPFFHPNLSAEKNLLLSARLLGDAAMRSIPGLLEKTGLKSVSGKKVGKFSSGMKQRLAIARALLGDPELLILDEPTNGMDLEASDATWRILKEFTADGKGAALVSSHLLHEIEERCNRVCVIHEGERLASGDVKELLECKNRPIEIICEDAESLARLEALAASASWIRKFGEVCRRRRMIRVICAEKTPAQICRYLSERQIGLEQFRPMRQTLKDFFLTLTAKTKKTKPDGENGYIIQS